MKRDNTVSEGQGMFKNTGNDGQNHRLHELLHLFAFKFNW